MSTEREKIHCTNCGTEWHPTRDDLLKIRKGWTIQCPRCSCEITKEDYHKKEEEQTTLQKIQESKKVGLCKRWFAKDNFVYAGQIMQNHVAECNSNIVALHIACAHNAILESAPQN